MLLALVGMTRWLARTYVTQALDAYDNHNALKWLEWSAYFRNDPGEIALGRVRAYRRLRQFDLVRTNLLRAEAAGVSRRKLEREQWLTLAQAGQLESVESKLPLLLNDPTMDPRDVCEAYVTGFLLTARPGPALELIVPWLADFPQDAEAYYLKGRGHALGRHFAEAEQALVEARRLAPQRADIALSLAEALLELQQPQAALALFQSATHDSTLSDQAWFGVAQAARRSGHPEQTIEVLQSLLERSPKLGAAWEELGSTQLDQGKIAEACQSLQQAVELSPKSLSAHQAIARALISHGEQAKAKPHLEFVVQATEAMEKIRLLEDKAELDSKDIATRFQIARLYQEYDTPDAAIAWARSVLLLDPRHAGARALLQELQPEPKESHRR